jgi:hypothetical protein
MQLSPFITVKFLRGMREKGVVPYSYMGDSIGEI